MKKLELMIIIFICCFSFFLLSYFKSRNYELIYEKSNYKVTEKYLKEDKNYVVNVEYKKDNYSFIIPDSYHRSRKLVKTVKKYEVDGEICIEINFNGNKVMPTCKNNDGFISLYQTSDKMKSKVKITKYKEKVKTNSFEYKNIKVNFLNNKKVLVWNYHGFYYLDNKKKDNIKITNTDVYNPSSVGQIDNYLIIPNYDQGYEYKIIKILNINNFDIDKLELEEPLSNESYVLGTNEKSIFLFDKKYEREFEIVPYKLKYRTVTPRIYENGNLIEKSSTYLATNEASFKYDDLYTYEIKNNNLYRKNKYNDNLELISRNNIKEIIKENNDEVYYLVDDKLYMYSDKYGEVLLLEYFELNFNYKNIIYIF